MELRQIRYFTRVVELGSISRASLDLGVAQSAISLQISRLESELSVRLLRRTPRGVIPTEAGAAFLREAQLILRHADRAVSSAQGSRLAGRVSVGLAPAAAPMLALPFLRAVQEQYPDISLHVVESLSGHLAHMLDNRQLDFAILFSPKSTPNWHSAPLLEQKLYLIRPARRARSEALPPKLALQQLRDIPLLLPTTTHGLRTIVDAACLRSGFRPRIEAEIDSLAVLMDAVYNGMGATVQPWAAIGRYADAETAFHLSEIDDPRLVHTNSLCSLFDEELHAAARRARRILRQCVTSLVEQGQWPGARLLEA